MLLLLLEQKEATPNRCFY